MASSCARGEVQLRQTGRCGVRNKLSAKSKPLVVKSYGNTEMAEGMLWGEHRDFDREAADTYISGQMAGRGCMSLVNPCRVLKMDRTSFRYVLCRGPSAKLGAAWKEWQTLIWFQG